MTESRAQATVPISRHNLNYETIHRMFNSTNQVAEKRKSIRIVSADASLLARAEGAFGQNSIYNVSTINKPLAAARQPLLADPGDLLIAELSPPFEQGVALLEDLVRASEHGTANIIIIADDVGAIVSRHLLKLNISDWLTRNAEPSEFFAAAHTALTKSGARDWNAT